MQSHQCHCTVNRRKVLQADHNWAEKEIMKKNTRAWRDYDIEAWVTVLLLPVAKKECPTAEKKK